MLITENAVPNKVIDKSPIRPKITFTKIPLRKPERLYR